jgi:hypothetical protein
MSEAIPMKQGGAHNQIKLPPVMAKKTPLQKPRPAPKPPEAP